MKNKKIIIFSAIVSLGLIFYFFIFSAKNISNENKGASGAESAAETSDDSNNKSEKIEKQEATIIFTGDVMLSRAVAGKIKAKKDINYPFLKIKDYLKSADAVFVNLENPITAGAQVTTDSMVFQADPGIEKALKYANISIVSLANNHTPNYGEKGLKDTFMNLKKAGIDYSGAGKDEIEASRPVVSEIKSYRFAFLSYNDSDVVPASYGAGSNRAGTNLMNIGKLKEAVEKAKAQADFVIISMHSGKEYTEKLTASQTGFARAAIDAGAELVIGHHPHVVQRIEKYKNKYIFYSLGNFVFDQMWSEETKKGIACKIVFKPTGVEKIEISAIRIKNYSQPEIMTGKDAQSTFDRLRISAADEKIKLIR